MQLQFVPVEEFYFALTLDTRLLYEWQDPTLCAQAGERLQKRFGEPSTVAAARQNTFNYVFRVVEGVPPATLVELLDWGGQLRLNSNYGLERGADGKVTRLASFEERPQFAAEVARCLAEMLALPLG